MKFHRASWPSFDPATYVHNWHIDAVAEHLQGVMAGHIRILIITEPPRTMKSSMTSASFPAFVWAQPKPSALCGAHVKFIGIAYDPDLSIRDATKSRRIIDSPWYQDRWGDRFKIRRDLDRADNYENTAGGFRMSTSIGGKLTGEGGDIIIVDDPINAKKANWESARQTVNEFWDETLPTRLNDQRTGAFIVIMQRLHEDDLVGHILDKADADDVVHLNLPMEFDPALDTRTYVNGRLFFEDPREEPEELLWPERFPRGVVDALKVSLGPFACTPGESPVLMSDLSLRPIAQVKAGDEIVGFTTDTAKATKRRSLVKTTVQQVFSYQADIVKVTLDSGEVIRCTPDHKWYDGKEGGLRGRRANGSPDFRPLYRPAKVGRSLQRICPAALPALTEQQSLDAAWLAGFFDGEGSVSSCAKRGQKKLNGDHYRDSASVTFTQGTEKHPAICEKLERVLASLNFQFDIYERRRKQNHWQQTRAYTLRGTNLPLFQRFLHQIGPSKWHGRLAQGAYGANFIVGQEKVASIEPDGNGTVYALETTTGNYVVWGLASSNSAAQLQQAPSPRGGGIIDRMWWQTWPAPGFEPDRFPPCSLIIASLDTGYGEKEENAFNALTVWGIFEDHRERTGVVMMEAWRGRWPLRGMIPEECKTDDERKPYWGLAEKVADTIRRRNIDILLVENKTRGGDLVAEVRRLLRGVECQLILLDPVGNKVARLHAVQPVFSDGRVFAPEKAWAETVITEVSQFPKSKFADYTDTVSQALAWLRKQGILLLGVEADQENLEASTFRSKPQPRYDV